MTEALPAVRGGNDAIAGANPGRQRTRWVDIARGIGIILVVYGHALRGNYHGFAPGSWQARQDRLIYAFHMPMFFLLAGLFLWGSVGRGRLEFVKGRWSQVVYPYLLWSLISAAIAMPMGNLVNTPISWRDTLLIPFVPIDQYWFLYDLFLLQLVVAFIYPRKWMLFPIGLAGLALVAWLGSGWIVVRAFLFLPFVAVGMIAAPWLQKLGEAGPAGGLLLSIGGWLSFAGVMAGGWIGEATILHTLLAGLAGSAGTIGLAMLAARARLLTSLLAALGEASLTIYLMHSICSAGVRIVLKLAGIAPGTWVSFSLSALIGLLAPFVVWRLATVRGWTRPLGLGGAPAIASKVASA